MALIKCPECGKEISDKAPACPNCGMPLRREDRGTYNVTIVREKQWFLINPKISITVDASDKYSLANDSSIIIPMTTGHHSILFSFGIRETRTDIDVTEEMVINVKFNRVTGELEVSGYKTVSQTNSPNVSIGVGVGGFKSNN